VFNFIIEIFLATNFDLKQQRHFRLKDFTGMKSVVTGKKKYWLCQLYGSVSYSAS